MALTYRQSEGARAATTRVIVSITGGVVTVTGGDVGGPPLIGDLMEVFGDTVTAANNGFYTLTVLDTAPSPDTYQLRPAPVDQSGGTGAAKGTLARIVRLAARTLGSSNVTSVLVDSFDTQLAFIEVAGANFRTAGVVKNDRVAFRGSATTANNGAWIAHAVISEDVLMVRTPDGGTGMTNQAVDGTIEVRRGNITVNFLDHDPILATKAGTDTFTFSASAKTITRAGTPDSWIAEGFAVGQHVHVGSTSSNDGVTDEITGLNATVLTFANGTLVDEFVGSGATFQARGITAANMLTGSYAGVPQNGPTGGSPYFGSGELRDFLQLGPIQAGTGEKMNLVLMEGIARFAFDYSTLTTPAFFASLKEVWVGRHCTPNFFLLNSGSWDSTLTFSLGRRPGDRYSMADGGVWVGLTPAVSALTPLNLYGSFIAPCGIDEIHLNVGGDAIGCVTVGRFNVYDGLVESVACYGNEGNASGAIAAYGTGDQANILVGRQNAQSSITVDATIGGLLLSDQVLALQAFNNNATLVEIRSPRTDLDLSGGRFSNTFSTSSYVKTYLFNPRFVSRDSSGVVPSPIDVLSVIVTEINETTLDEQDYIVDVTDGTGYLVGGGAYLRRQVIEGTGEVPTLFSHRVTLQGAGFRIVVELIQMTGDRIGDWAVDRISPNYEDEFGE